MVVYYYLRHPRGHPYLPVDRVFEGVSSILEMDNIILSSEKYNGLYCQIGGVRELGKTWELQKSATN